MVQPVMDAIGALARYFELAGSAALADGDDNAARAVGRFRGGDVKSGIRAPPDRSDPFVLPDIQTALRDIGAPALDQFFLCYLFQPKATGDRPIVRLHAHIE